VKGNLEHRLHRVIRMAIRYMDDPESHLVKDGMPDRTKTALADYFYGDDGIRTRFEAGLKRIEEGKKPFFLNERNIFERSSQGTGDHDFHGGRKIDEDEVRTIVEQILKDRGLVN